MQENFDCEVVKSQYIIGSFDQMKIIFDQMSGRYSLFYNGDRQADAGGTVVFSLNGYVIYEDNSVTFGGKSIRISFEYPLNTLSYW